MFFTFIELPDILLGGFCSIVQVDDFGCSVHVIIKEGTRVDIVLSFLDAFLSLSDIFLEGTLEVAVLVEDKLTHSIFFVVDITAHIVCSIWIDLLPELKLFAIFPLPLVDPVQIAIFVLAISVGFI
jgi:hypothetical protein